MQEFQKVIKEKLRGVHWMLCGGNDGALGASSQADQQQQLAPACCIGIQATPRRAAAIYANIAHGNYARQEDYKAET